MKKDLNHLLTRTRNPFEISRVLGCKISDVRQKMREAPSDLAGWGRPNLQPHIISRRRVSASSWPAEDLPTILEHRRLHDQGRVTMCQGRDGEWVIQYAVIMQRPIRRNVYFHGV